MFLAGFFSCALLMFLISAAPISTTFDSKDAIYNEIQNIYANLNKPQFQIVASSPIPSQLIERQIVLYSSTTFNSFGAVQSQFVSEFTKVNGSTFSATFQRL